MTGVTVAAHLQSTTNPSVFAAGDAADTPGLPLTPVAVLEGKVAAALSEQDATSSGLDLDVRFTDTSGWDSNYRIGETAAAVKILIDRSNDSVVGAHMFGPNYGELVNFLGLAIESGLTTRQLKSMIAAYPSVASDLGSMI